MAAILRNFLLLLVSLVTTRPVSVNARMPACVKSDLGELQVSLFEVTDGCPVSRLTCPAFSPHIACHHITHDELCLNANTYLPLNEDQRINKIGLCKWTYRNHWDSYRYPENLTDVVLDDGSRCSGSYRNPRTCRKLTKLVRTVRIVNPSSHGPCIYAFQRTALGVGYVCSNINVN